MHPLFAGIGDLAGACGSVLFYGSPLLIIGGGVFFYRRANKKPAKPAPAGGLPGERLIGTDLEEPVHR